MQAFTVPYPPSLNSLRAVYRNRMITTREGRVYKERVGWEAKRQFVKIMEGPLSVTMRVYRPRRSGDLDNCMKALFDSLKGIAWVDDSQVVEIRAQRFEDKLNPRVDMEVSLASLPDNSNTTPLRSPGVPAHPPKVEVGG